LDVWLVIGKVSLNLITLFLRYGLIANSLSLAKTFALKPINFVSLYEYRVKALEYANLCSLFWRFLAAAAAAAAAAALCVFVKPCCLNASWLASLAYTCSL
jgi:hypothetical protein